MLTVMGPWEKGCLQQSLDVPMIHRLGVSAASNSHCWTVSLSMKVRSDLNFAAQVRPVDCVPFWKV